MHIHALPEFKTIFCDTTIESWWRWRGYRSTIIKYYLTSCATSQFQVRVRTPRPTGRLKRTDSFVPFPTGARRGKSMIIILRRTAKIAFRFDLWGVKNCTSNAYTAAHVRSVNIDYYLFTPVRHHAGPMCVNKWLFTCICIQCRLSVYTFVIRSRTSKF